MVVISLLLLSFTTREISNVVGRQLNKETEDDDEAILLKMEDSIVGKEHSMKVDVVVVVIPEEEEDVDEEAGVVKTRVVDSSALVEVVEVVATINLQ